jgi:integrase/recombinase XerC
MSRDMQLQEALQAFLLQLSANGRSRHIIDQYRRHVSALIRWVTDTGAGTDVNALTPEVLARFFADDATRLSARGGSKKAVSMNAMRTSVRCFCAYLHDSGLVAANPARLLRRARCSPAPPRALRDDEQKRLHQVLADAKGAEANRDRVLIQLLLGTGIRIGSAIGLDIEDIDLQHGEITLRTSKNDRPSIAILPADVARKLKRFIGRRPTGPVFLAGENRISVRHSQRRLAGWMAAADIEGKSAHSLRHSFATGLLGRTGDLRLVQAAMNHASIVSTTIYTAVDRHRLRAAVGRA